MLALLLLERAGSAFFNSGSRGGRLICAHCDQPGVDLEDVLDLLLLAEQVVLLLLQLVALRLELRRGRSLTGS